MSHISLKERYEISVLKKQGFSNTEIAESLSRHKSSIGQESEMLMVEVNADLAHRKATTRDQEKNKLKAFTAEVQERVVYWLKKYYSPEQIKGRAEKDKNACVSPERIYQFIWQDKKKGGVLYKHSRTH